MWHFCVFQLLKAYKYTLNINKNAYSLVQLFEKSTIYTTLILYSTKAFYYNVAMDNKNTTKTKNNIDTVKNEPLTIEEIRNTIPDIIEAFCIENKIEDLKKESNNLHLALLHRINKQLIEPNKQTLYTKEKTNNAYNLDIINELLNIYIDLCMTYDATCTILGFGAFSGLGRDTIYNLQYETKPREYTNNITGNTHKQNISGCDIWQKLRYYEEQTTLNCRKYNDLRIIARLNRITGGAYRDYVQNDTTNTQHIQLDGEQIADKYGALQGSENPPQLPTASSPIDKN